MEIVAAIEPLVRSTTLTVLSPSPAHSSLRENVTTTPFGPDVVLVPVNPLKPPIWVAIEFSVVSTTSMVPFERSAR